MLGKILKRIVSRFKNSQEENEILEKCVAIASNEEIEPSVEVETQVDLSERPDIPNECATTFSNWMKANPAKVGRTTGNALRRSMELIDKMEEQELIKKRIAEAYDIPYDKFCELAESNSIEELRSGLLLTQHWEKVRGGGFGQMIEDNKNKNRIRKFRVRAYAKVKGIDYKVVRDFATTKEELITILKEY